MEAELRKNFTYYEQLEQIIDAFNDDDGRGGGRDIQVPFQFFFDLFREQEREVIKLGSKVKEAERLAEKLRQETVAKQRDAAQGKLVVDSDLEQVSLRDKIFQICSMLNELQSKAGLKLA